MSDKDKPQRPQEPLPGVLATAEKRITALEDMLAEAVAELHMYGVAMNTRASGALGADGIKFLAPTSRGMFDAVRASVLRKLRGE